MVVEYDYLCRLVIIGDAGIGKTSFVRYYEERTFHEPYLCCIGVDFKIKTINLDGKVVRLHLWDTAGQERFGNMGRGYYRGAHGVFLAYDVTDAKSFESIQHWKQQIDKYAPGNVNIVMLGCKSDLGAKRQVSYDEGKALADALDVDFIETSAKLAMCIDAAVEMLTRKVLLSRNPVFVVLTLVSVVVEASGHLTLSIATIGGEILQVRITGEDATVAAAISRLSEDRGLEHVKLVSTGGTMLAPEELLPGAPCQQACRRCVVQ